MLTSAVFIIGARSLLYGSALGLGGVLLLGSFTIRALDVADPAQFKARMQALADPVALSAQETLLPLKGHIQVGLTDLTAMSRMRASCLLSVSGHMSSAWTPVLSRGERWQRA